MRSVCSWSRHQARGDALMLRINGRATSGVMVGGERRRSTTQSENGKGLPARWSPNRQRASFILLTVDRGLTQTSSAVPPVNTPSLLASLTHSSQKAEVAPPHAERWIPERPGLVQAQPKKYEALKSWWEGQNLELTK